MRFGPIRLCPSGSFAAKCVTRAVNRLCRFEQAGKEKKRKSKGFARLCFANWVRCIPVGGRGEAGGGGGDSTLPLQYMAISRNGTRQILTMIQDLGPWSLKAGKMLH